MIEIPLTTVNDAINGKREAVDYIIRTLEAPIFNLAYRMMLNQEDAKDATQETLIRIITRLSSYNAEAKFTTWAWRVALNRIMDYKDALYSQARVDTEQFVDDINHGLDMNHTETPEEALILTQLKIGCATAMLHSLDGSHRAAYILVEIMDLDTRESAQILGIKEATLRKQISRARLKLRQTLDHCGIVNPAVPCRCYRRLTNAKERGRVPELPIKETIKVDEISVLVQKIDRLAQTSAFYRAEPALHSDLRDHLQKIIQINPTSMSIS